MDELIEKYKQELINDDGGSYGYPVGLKSKIIKEVENNDFEISVKKVQEMLECARRQTSNTSDGQLTIPDVIKSVCPKCGSDNWLHDNLLNKLQCQECFTSF